MFERGNLFVISAPSGTGKTTLVKALVDSLPRVTVSISHTTRLKRPTETHGVNYYFTDENKFREMIQHGDFLEYATVFNHFYGTSRAWVEETLNHNMDVILEIDWQGCQQIQRLFPDCITIFILPPSLSALSERLTLRNQDKTDSIQKRLIDARETISHLDEFDYIVLNDNFEEAIQDLKTILLAKRLNRKRQMQRLATLLAELSMIQK